MPFHFWSVTAFVVGCVTGSFLNVCIHRLPRGESIVSPPSHCPHCGRRIPWHLNLPLISWLALRGRCAWCRAPISPRYFVVELITGLAFLGVWLRFGAADPAAAAVWAVFLAGLIAATFIDVEHFIIPDRITLGGAAAGFLFSFFVPAVQGTSSSVEAMTRSLVGAAAGAGSLYLVLRGGKLLFGRKRLRFEAPLWILFGRRGLHLPEESAAYEDLLYRGNDRIRAPEAQVELEDRCLLRAEVRAGLKGKEVRELPSFPQGGSEASSASAGREEALFALRLRLEEGPLIWARCKELILPREVMGLGDVKFLAAIGAFTGWQGALFAIMASALIGSAAGLAAVALGRRQWSAQIPYGPYLAAAAALWIFAGPQIAARWLGM